MEYEIYHAGVKGMKWGVRKDASSASTGARKTSTGKKSPDEFRKASVKVTKTRKGAKVVAKHNNQKVKVIVANVANVSAGALRVAAAFIPGASLLSGVATVASLTGTVASLKK